MESILGNKSGKKCFLLMLVIAVNLTALPGQEQPKQFIKGQLKEKQTMQAVGFATVALRRASDSTLITGTSTNIDGEFILEQIADGKYSIIISAIGYVRVTINIDLKNNYDMGTVLLQENTLKLGEVEVVGERIKAKAEAEKTIYFINKKMYDASDNGVDILSYIPGVQVDIMKNISLEGSQHIIIMVDGKQRDRSFLSQLNSSQIDKVEIINTPDSRYDADVTGVINIILKKDRESRFNGHIHAEMPTSESAIYVFPDYSFNYSFNKLNLFTSYNGEFSYFNNIESSNRNFWDKQGTTQIISDQNVRQQDWSHRFHYGFDYMLNEKNQINFYGYYNPYSNELNGNVKLQVTGDNTGDQNWSALKQDKDINRSVFYSFYYKHLFSKPGREIAFDLSYFNFMAENSTTYVTTLSVPDGFMTNRVNAVKPRQNSVSFKMDYSSPVTEKFRFDAGIKVRTQMLRDRLSDEFKYDESILALYGTITYTFSKFTLSTGIRAEKSASGLTNSFDNKVLALLPNVTINYKPTSKDILKLSYNRTVYRPNVYELNPYTSIDDPYTVQSGNPFLKPEFRQMLSADYSKTLGNNYISLQLFYLDRSNAISHYTFINNAGAFETRVDNLGDIHGYGSQLAGALKFKKAIALNPYLKLTRIYTTVNNLAKQYEIDNIHGIAFESGLSAIVTFRYDIVASLQFQYKSPLVDIQNISFSDALYFITLEKTFRGKFKVGIMSALPFTKRFNYQGTETRGENFYSHSEGNIKLPAFPVWFKFNYQFNSGKASNRVNHSKEDIDNMPKKGF